MYCIAGIVLGFADKGEYDASLSLSSRYSEGRCKTRGQMLSVSFGEGHGRVKSWGMNTSRSDKG